MQYNNKSVNYYRKNFNKWKKKTEQLYKNNQRVELYYLNIVAKDTRTLDCIEKNTLSYKDFQSLTPIYTTDKNAKYYKIRSNAVFKKFYITRSGIVLSFEEEDARLKKPTSRGRKKTQRLAYHFHLKGKTISIAPETLVGIVFECDCSTKALELIQRKGMYALTKRDCNGICVSDSERVECHHISNYTDNPKITKKLMSENCRLSNLQLLTAEEHAALTRLKPSETQSKKKQLDQVLKLNKATKDNNCATAFVSNGERAGTVTNEFTLYVDEQEQWHLKVKNNDYLLTDIKMAAAFH